MTLVNNRSVAFALLALLCTEVAGDNAQQWVERMTHAAQSLNYDGTFVYRNGAVMESMRIIHRASGEGERSRMVSLTGPKREVLRDRTRVICISTDDEQVVVTKTRPPNEFSANVLNAKAGFDQYYDLEVGGGDRVAGRSTEVLDLVPQDLYRYGYRLWVDRETGLLLKSDLLADVGPPLEQFIYTSIELPDSIPDQLLEPGISGHALTWQISEGSKSTPHADAPRETGRWQVTWVPEGFMMMDHSALPVATGRMPVEQFVYTDGLASLSVFIEQLEASEPLEGLSAMGAVNAFGVLVDEYQVTVVGEVPSRTVEQIARSVLRVND